MQAVVFHEFGGPDVLKLEEVADPQPAAGEVLIDIAVGALNHLDVDIREGVSRFDVAPPFILGVRGRRSHLGPRRRSRRLAGRRARDALSDGHVWRVPLLQDRA